MTNFFIVGGFVRDKILNAESKDIDFAVEAESFDAMRQAIIERKGTIFLETPKFFTIRARMPFNGKMVAADFVLCRKEGQYKDGRHPEFVEIGTLFDDLARRDFTMNALAMSEEGRLIDFFDGCLDIHKKVIRCVGNAEDRFNEDSLRLLRAVRFAITKNFSLHKDIDDCLKSSTMCFSLKNISSERIREELHKAFKANTPRMLEMFEEYKYLKQAVCSVSGLWLKPTFEE